MGIDIRNMKVLQTERQVREIINTPNGVIEIYEPTIEDLAKIIDIQREKELGMEIGTVSFDGVTVIRELFPMLTNIELGDLSDEELKEIIENPSVHLLITQQIVAQIVAEANKLYAERVKTELKNSESTLAQVELLNAIPAMIIEKAKHDGKIAELVKEVERVSEELDETIKREKEKLETQKEVQETENE